MGVGSPPAGSPGRPISTCWTFADTAVADELTGAVELLPGALLAADLEDLAGGLDDVGEVAAFGDGEGRGFLEVDVFACADGVGAYAGVLVIGGGDDYGVDVFCWLGGLCSWRSRGCRRRALPFFLV